MLYMPLTYEQTYVEISWKNFFLLNYIGFSSDSYWCKQDRLGQGPMLQGEAPFLKYVRKPNFSIKYGGRWRRRREKEKGSSITDSKRNPGEFPVAQWQKKQPQPIGLPLWWWSSEPQFSFTFLCRQTGQTHQFSLCFLACSSPRAVNVYNSFHSLDSLQQKRGKNWILLVVVCGFWGDCWLRWCLVYLKETGSKEKGRRELLLFYFSSLQKENLGWKVEVKLPCLVQKFVFAFVLFWLPIGDDCEVLNNLANLMGVYLELFLVYDLIIEKAEEMDAKEVMRLCKNCTCTGKCICRNF